ncbi:MAG: hypothetical protein H6568_13575 [Lewinellaceae bacterium]|nr:hypothetical protein [Saprospiraceae bacterium]MCB9313785.1 hypothetical protein [Lewinellaceae bacterium]
MDRTASHTRSDAEWTPLLHWIDQAMLDGVALHPMPASIRHQLEAWGMPLSEDPVDAFHEALALVMPLYHSRPASQMTDGPAMEQRPPPTRDWTTAQEDSISRILKVQGMPGATEAAWLIQRNGWHWPESAVSALLAHLQDHPRDWPTLGRHLPPLAAWLTRQLTGHPWAYPEGPPDRRQIGFTPMLTYLFRWIQLTPDPALTWLADHHAELDNELWEAFLDQFHDLLPAESLDLLRRRTDLAPADRRIRWLQTRARLGDPGLLEEVMDRIGAMWRMEGGMPSLVLPKAGPAWEWSGSIPPNGSFNRTTALYDLASCLPPNYWTSRTGMTPDTFLDAIFRSDQQRIWVNLVYHQLGSMPDPDWCLAFLGHHLAHPEIVLDGPVVPLARYIPSTRLAPLLESRIRLSRFQLWLDRPEGQLLVSPGLFWTEGLLETVFHAFQMRPALAYEAAVSEAFMTALAWRSHLGGMLRRSSGRGLQQSLPGPLSRLAPDILQVILLRQDLHQAFDPKATSRA